MIANHIHDALRQVESMRAIALERARFRGYSGRARMAGWGGGFLRGCHLVSSVLPGYTAGASCWLGSGACAGVVRELRRIVAVVYARPRCRARSGSVAAGAGCLPGVYGCGLVKRSIDFQRTVRSSLRCLDGDVRACACCLSTQPAACESCGRFVLRCGRSRLSVPPRRAICQSLANGLGLSCRRTFRWACFDKR